MQSPNLFDNGFWLLGIIVTWVNFFIWSNASIKNDLSPEDQAVRRRYLFNFAVITSLPWLVMGVGSMTGMTPSVIFYFRPQDGNPFVIGWLAGVFIMQLWLSWWISFADGARKMAYYKLGRARVGKQSKPVPERLTKAMAIGMPFFFCFWVYLMIGMDAKMPHRAPHGTAPVTQNAP